MEVIYLIINYNVIDVAELYEGIPKKQMYLVLSRDSKSAKCTRKIMVSKRRLLHLNYFEDEDVQVLIFNKETGTYQCKKVLLKDGKYRVNSIVNRSFHDVRRKYDSDWELIIDFFYVFTDVLTISDHAIVVKGSESELITLKDIKVEDSTLLLKRVKCKFPDVTCIEGFFNKCIYGEPIKLNDFQALVDDVVEDIKIQNLSIEFNNITFEVDGLKKLISVQMIMDSYDEVNETMSFTISTDRVVGMTFLLIIKLAEIESVEDKVKFLNGRIIY